MSSAAQQLARIGFADMATEPVCWRVERLDEPERDRVPDGSEPGADLLGWLVLLGRDASRSPYRISRVGS